ncbi:hypothetical protein JHL18_11815 [Clostridium sp. YIM B02505]|uniref:CMP-N-acetylneuraminic acid synthetase n=1 Tax=Clostridium yunnanense TaxID=2800325 RepID=A0ABS1EPE9_9CLOT|nr:hypothetical protein [Clostridium yunnanense]MBK1811313.1 hypothetical protein [Clostridium yunnanense]
MKTVAFVPIKLKNERYPGKNTQKFYDGKPLISFILESVRRISCLSEIYVYCSQDEISDYLLPGIRYLKRPDFLDLPTATPQDIISEFMKQVDADIYMVSHATSPFVTVEHLEECIKAVMNEGYDSAFTGKKIQSLLWTDKLEPLNFDPSNIPRTQELKPLYAEVSAAYVFTRDIFEKTKCRTGGKTKIIEVSDIECIDIDYYDSFLIADAVYHYKR